MSAIRLIVIGGSAGAVDALAKILPALPARFAIPVAIVVHQPPDKNSVLAEVLSTKCALPVREADDKEPISPGVVYLASPNYHLLVERSGCFSLSVDDPVHFSRPAIDVLFESAAEAMGEALLGVLLSGANEDGAEGLARIRDGGGITVVQSPSSALVAAMPAAALRLGTPNHVLPIGQIGPFLAAVPQSQALKRSHP